MMIFRASSVGEIKKVVDRIFTSKLGEKIPVSKKAKIFIKMNANSDMIGLTGNTTDLRLVVAVVEFFLKRGYRNIILGDGTSSGFINAKIDSLRRLSVYKLGEVLGIKILDLNKAESKEIVLLHNYHLKVAKICFEADYFINLPKLKTHGETQMSCCLKNLIGCVAGLNKQIIHRDLAGNILEINKIIKPDIHIVDAILPMEGLGPSRGIPKNVGLILADKDPFLLDLACSQLMGRRDEEIPYLRLAKRQKLINPNSFKNLKKTEIKKFRQVFQYPNPNFLQRFINHPIYRLFFVKIRYAPAFFHFFSSSIVSKPMYWLGIRQDLFIKKEGKITRIKVANPALIDNRRLSNYCPMSLNVAREINSPRCIHCLYCYFVDKKNALKLEGEFHHLNYQIKKYKPLIEKIANQE